VTVVRERRKAVGLQVLCSLLGPYTRQAYYKHQRREEKVAIEAELVIKEVIGIRSVQKRIGGRKMYYMLGGFFSDHKIKMGRNVFFDLLRDQGLLVPKRRKYRPRTTFAYPWRRFPNLIKDYVPLGPNEVWAADITYLHIGNDFGYLSLITDAYSHKIVGYKLSRRLCADGPVAALRMALRNNPNREFLIHHSDRGVQYHSTAYMKMLGGEIRVSMTTNGDPLQNAIAERVNGILKDELLEGPFASFRDASRRLDEAVSIYNHLRPHMSIENLVPAVAHTRTGALKRLWKNYYSKRPIAQAMA
jgi:transposase InsO family protein